MFFRLYLKRVYNFHAGPFIITVGLNYANLLADDHFYMIQLFNMADCSYSSCQVRHFCV